jgi:hypothetical protein
MTWARVILTVLCILTGLLWQFAPRKPFSATLSTQPHAGRAEQTADLGLRPVSATQCGSCHMEHFKEWSGSVHSRSLTSENFFKTFSDYLDFVGKQAREDPQASMACLGCHAPLLKNADPQIVRQVTAFVLAKETASLDGFEVGCVACHVEGGGVYSGPIGDPKDNPFHRSKFSRSYRDSSFCAACHTWTAPAIPCSDVYSDWKKSRAAKQGKTCQSCHMAEQDGTAAAGGSPRKIHGHTFPGGRSAAMLQQAVSIRLKAAFRKDRLEVAATVRNLVPHRVPDG